MRRLDRPAVLAMLVLVLLAAALAGPSAAFAKDYHIASIDIDATFPQPNGDMHVAEKRWVAFNGDFHWAQWALAKKTSVGNPSQRTEIRFESVVFDGKPMTAAPAGTSLDQTPPPGTYILEDQGDKLVIKVGFSASNESVPFRLQYTVVGAATRWKDTGELYWQFVGNETDVRTDKVRVNIVLPETVQKSEVKTWAHGPLNGVVSIGETRPPKNEPGPGTRFKPQPTVTLDVSDVPPRTFVEARVLFPASTFPAAPLIDQPRLQQVLSEEAALANQANEQRARAKQQVFLGYLGAFAVPIAALLGVIFLFFKYGKEYKPQEFTGQYYRDIPGEYAPPLVGALWRMGQPADADVSASLMDLSIKGVVYMHPITQQDQGGFLGMGAHDEQTYELQLQRDKIGGIDPLERSLLTFLFDDTMQRDSFTIHDLRDEAKARPQAFTRGLSAWKSEVARKAQEYGWVEKSSRGAQAGAFALSALALAAPIVALVTTGYPLFLLGVVFCIPAFVVSFFVSRRSRAAVELYAKYRGLRDYMRDFGRMQEKPPASVVLWEQYLVLAVVFGIADQVIAQMRVAVPEVVNDPAFATAYWWATPAYSGGESPVGSLTSGFASAVSAANSAQSSASGGGGGFSGGGGGGGGGGGFSAG